MHVDPFEARPAVRARARAEVANGMPRRLVQVGGARRRAATGRAVAHARQPDLNYWIDQTLRESLNVCQTGAMTGPAQDSRAGFVKISCGMIRSPCRFARQRGAQRMRRSWTRF